MVNNTARALAVALGCCLASAAGAEPAADALREIQYLLGYVGASGCAFQRNGAWHDAKAARAHINTKYEYLLAQNQIETAENFIDRAATKSSLMFGKPYAIQCGGAAPVPSGQWLSEALARYRADQSRRGVSAGRP